MTPSAPSSPLRQLLEKRISQLSTEVETMFVERATAGGKNLPTTSIKPYGASASRKDVEHWVRRLIDARDYSPRARRSS